MRYEVFNLRKEPINGFMPTLTAYIIDDCRDASTPRKRPAVLICPGGAYAGCSPREGEPIALQYMAAGYHAFVLDYAVAPANHYPEPQNNAFDAIRLIRARSGDWGIDPDKIVVMGFSAGGHLAASVATLWDEKPFKTQDKSNRPNAVLLGYPVISSKAEITHEDSIINLCGNDKVLRQHMSLEDRVTDKMPPCFIWHTFTDQAVSVENSILFAQAMVKAGVPCEMHIYPHGVHGLALANSLTAVDGYYIDELAGSWFSLSLAWLEDVFKQNK